jgi:hypothetical protein
MSEQRFSGTDRYVATEDLTTAVNAAVTLGRPILIKGEPTGGRGGARSGAPHDGMAREINHQGSTGPV